MSLKFTLLLVWFICLFHKMVMTGCEVILVNRNGLDSFRVGKDGCKLDTSVCTSHTTCQSDGSCLCSDDEPNFRNPRTKAGDGKDYGCIDSESIRKGDGKTDCILDPFQLIPYSPKEPATKFTDIGNPDILMKSCSLKEGKPVLAKFPDNATKMELQWLNQSYVDLNVSNKVLYFKWKRSVPDLQGTIITFNLYCEVVNNSRVNAHGKLQQNKCLRAKVLGTWSADAVPDPTKTSTASEPTVTSSHPKPSQIKTTPSVKVTTAEPSHPNPLDEGPSSDGNSSGTIIVIAVVVAAVLLLILAVVVWWFCKRKKRNSPRNSSRGRSCKEDGSTSMKQFSYTESNSRGPDAYEDARDTKKTFATCSHPVYTTPDNQLFTAHEANDPAYATPNIQRVVVKTNDPNGYATPDSQRVMVQANDPAYATPKSQCVVVEVNSVYTTPESQRMPDSKSMVVEANPAYETPDSQSVVVEANPAYTTPDSQSVVVEANPAYETPDSQSVVVEANPAYETPDSQCVVVEANPAYETPDVKRKEANSANWNPEPGYESVDMTKQEANEVESLVDPGYATPDVKKTEVDRVNSYPEPGYETPDVKKKEVDAATKN